MQRHRFYAPPAAFIPPSNSDALPQQVILDAAESHHLARVLRLNVGAQAFVFDGAGNEYETQVRLSNPRNATLDIRAALTDSVESPLRLTLAQALCKGDKFDWIVQKATELGVTRVVPLSTAHSDIRLEGRERTEHKLARWRRIALEAVKQSGRRRLIEIEAPVDWDDFCAQEQSEVRLILAESDGLRWRDIAVSSQGSLTLAVGPEGGWHAAELASASATGFQRVHLGHRILRAETAAISALALAQATFGDS